MARNLILQVAILAVGGFATSTVQGEVIQQKCLGGASMADHDLAYSVLNDGQAMLSMITSGRAEVFEKGEVVSVTGHEGFLSDYTKVRKHGEITSFIVASEYVKDQPVQDIYNTGRDEKPVAVTTPVEQPQIEATQKLEPLPAPTIVVSAITENRWTDDALIVSATLTNTSTVTVLITGIDAMGFNQDQKMVSEGSNFTIVHNDLAPGAVVKFKVALKDGTKQVKFVKVVPSWFMATGLAAPSV